MNVFQVKRMAEEYPRWIGAWESVVGKNGQAYMIWRNPSKDIQMASPYNFEKGMLRNAVVKMCKIEHAERYQRYRESL